MYPYMNTNNWSEVKLPFYPWQIDFIEYSYSYILLVFVIFISFSFVDCRVFVGLFHIGA